MNNEKLIALRLQNGKAFTHFTSGYYLSLYRNHGRPQKEASCRFQINFDKRPPMPNRKPFNANYNFEGFGEKSISEFAMG